MSIFSIKKGSLLILIQNDLYNFSQGPTGSHVCSLSSVGLTFSAQASYNIWTSVDFIVDVYISNYYPWQNQRIVEVGREPWRLSHPAPLFKQGHLEQVTQNCVQTSEYLQGLRLYHLPGQSVPGLGHLLSKKCFLTFKKNLLSFRFSPLPLLSLDSTEPGVLQVWPHQWWTEEKIAFLDQLAALTEL